MEHGCLENEYKADFNCGNSCKALDKTDNKEVFIKRWHLDDIRGHNEIFALRQIQCNGVPSYIKSKEENGYLYMIRGWIRGVPLDEFMLANKSMSIMETLTVVKKICMLFSDLEKQVGTYLHGDIKPQNIIYDDINKQIFLVDFETFVFSQDLYESVQASLPSKSSSLKEVYGANELYKMDSAILSKLKFTGGHTISIVSEGFTAPEVYSGRILPASDVYSIGKLIAFLFGVCDIEGTLKDRWQFDEGLPKNIVDVIQKCLCKKIDKRYIDKTSILKDILNVNDTESIQKNAESTVHVQTSSVSADDIAIKKKTDMPLNDISEYKLHRHLPVADVKSSEILNKCAGEFEVSSNSAGGKMIPFAKRNAVDKVNRSRVTMDLQKRKVIYVAGNSCFASELSYVFANVMGLKTVLLETDNGIGTGTLNYFIDRQNTHDVSYVSENKEPFYCDIKQLYLSDENRWVSRGLLSESKNNKNLLISECNVFSEFGVINENDVIPLFHWTKNYFDITVVFDTVSTGGLIENSVIKYSDCIVVPVRANIDEVYIKYNQYKWLCRKNGVPYSKLLFVAWEYEKDKSLAEGNFKIAVEGLYGGMVRYDAERLKCKNVKGDYYCDKLEKAFIHDYKNIITKVIYR